MGIKQIARKSSKIVKFKSEAAETRYEENIQNRPLSVEKGFVGDNKDPIVPLVREFYANLTNPDDDTVAEAINTIFGLGDPVDEHSEFVEDIMEPELATVLETVAIAGAEWNISS
ncbi:hypothetical protein PanWU01x14_327210 [Parasponia andersonii]|uniref:Uncharacterized protein n=1 Tax=Parasponia andersonii TaxID=3476 RepID=A0A2P5AJ74_PARAD|nr:hypothetical protein PanWU01x14_327210 [Parasponia andersonii]